MDPGGRSQSTALGGKNRVMRMQCSFNEGNLKGNKTEKPETHNNDNEDSSIEYTA